MQDLQSLCCLRITQWEQLSWQDCLTKNKSDIADSDIDNLFKYVKPKTIFVKRPTENNRIVVLLCNYKFNPDHDLAIIFKNEKFEKIETDDNVL